MKKTTKHRVGEVLGYRQGTLFWPKLSELLASTSTPLPSYMKDIGVSWDKAVGSLERWYEELPDLEQDSFVVTDVPQPVVVKQCANITAMWHFGDNHVDIDETGVPAHIAVPVPLILAMADAIRKAS